MVTTFLYNILYHSVGNYVVDMGNLLAYLFCCLCLCFLVNLIKFMNRVLWNPIRTQSSMRAQGIKGPSYRFLHGNTREITDMRNRIMNGPMDLAHEMLPRIQPHIYSWIKLYGGNFLNWYGPKAQLVITEPELVLEVLNNKEGAYEKKQIQNYADKFLGGGLLSSRGEKWLKMRKLANQAFHGENLKGMIPAMVASAEAMLERWRTNEVKEIEMYQEFKVLTSEIISRTAFGSSYLEGKNIFDMLARMGSIVSRNNYKVGIPVSKNLLKTRDDSESEELERGIRESVLKMIRKREEELLKGNKDAYGIDFFGVLLKAYHDDDRTKKISVDDIIDECKSFYVAGHETTSSSLSWIVLFLAINPTWQERAREEVLQLFGKRNPSPDGIRRLDTMSMIINESLRLYPPAFNIVREVEKEVRLGKLILPEKMSVCLPILAVHNNPHVWGEDVHLFKPERFADGVAKATKNGIAAFLPFGGGPRRCIGLNFATSEMKIVLSMILQHYRFTLSPKYVHSPVHILTIAPQYGLQIMLQPL
ncbi:cytochrome P450 CYP749A22-like [Mercurialis annua]|uniref:cytochrome P450 CYP749A22-like n=1 Tax=Mercurialis annua TaxID=3986 RepID=UPI00215E524C|nr:cytochrome P450 CYP749A22-like [Mercurialis annua]